eukprot:CAMPEP_0119560956 /NCGR_PEP_ID=MMETSP1352-20130426/16263_1 /TAXON_ID=265584 /ORGANISM="Stauroneis constricta, Strain CCMP1120" /LENGTH=355 /DNA_ID=CAMNT_0007609039 /DNA_START=55 /DNA_END=1122 /DNA_ORIENTATION=+
MTMIPTQHKHQRTAHLGLLTVMMLVCASRSTSDAFVVAPAQCCRSASFVSSASSPSKTAPAPSTVLQALSSQEQMQMQMQTAAKSKSNKTTRSPFFADAHQDDRSESTATVMTATTSSSSAAAAATATQLNALELYCITTLEEWYSRSLKIKCPFFRRRTADVLDTMDSIMRFLVIRHKSIDFIGLPPTCASKKEKTTNLPIEQIQQYIYNDWKVSSQKGYYITGRLNSTIYKDDCWFDGPDPDMPVKGIQKYSNAASQLFDHSKSFAELLSISRPSHDVIKVEWKICGVLHLPWRPKLPSWKGTTYYYIDPIDHLIYRHEEVWENMSVVRAFTTILVPTLANSIWKIDEDGIAI